VLYPQNGDRIVTTDSVTSLHPMYSILHVVGHTMSSADTWLVHNSLQRPAYWLQYNTPFRESSSGQITIGVRIVTRSKDVRRGCSLWSSWCVAADRHRLRRPSSPTRRRGAGKSATDASWSTANLQRQPHAHTHTHTHQPMTGNFTENSARKVIQATKVVIALEAQRNKLM